MAYPVVYKESMNTVLCQGAEKDEQAATGNEVHSCGSEEGCEGLVLMSSELESIADAIFTQNVPPTWEAVAYPSLKPLGPWWLI